MNQHYDSEKDPEALMTPDQVAKMLSVPASTLMNWRCAGKGPIYIKMGDGIRARVRYHLRDVMKYINERRHYPSARARGEELDGTQAAR